LNLRAYLKLRRQMVDGALQRWLPAENEFPPEIHRAMRYSLFAGGKRLRPILALAGAETVGGKAVDALPLACSLEMIHTYSLIHDDLPAMDDDDLRRGQPTSHKVFGEGLAVLAGDALLTEAFYLLTRTDLMTGVSPRRRLRAIRLVARAAGSLGMIGGQAMDILAEGQKIEGHLLEYIHSHKTGALIAASVAAGAIIGGASEREFKTLRSYGEKLGLAFQVIDDLLDIRGEPRKLGKSTGKDRSRGKATYPAFFGITDSRRQAEVLVEEALLHLRLFPGQANPLREIAKYILKRTN